jgi:hypothetical protein
MTRKLSGPVKTQLVLKQMAKDPSGRVGPSLVKEGIAMDMGIHLTRYKFYDYVLFTPSYYLLQCSDFIKDTMREVDPDGFTLREPTSRKISRRPLVALGPHDEWSCDGHDKLVKYGFPIWGVRDKWTALWLGLWVVPNNRDQRIIAYVFLSLVRDLGGKLQINHLCPQRNIHQVCHYKLRLIVEARQRCCTVL